MAGKFIVLLCLIVLSKGIDISSLKLEQVLILSRHNVRTPLTEGLQTYSARDWPKWSDAAGHLTQKGMQLEGYMGKYIAEWLDSEDFIEGCPEKDDILVYANTKPRTLASAEAFLEGAFPLCNVTVEHYKDLAVFDPLFFPIFHNTSQVYLAQVREEMENKLNEVNLAESYTELAKIIQMENANICKQLFMCDLNTPKTEIVIEDGEEPNVRGPLFIGNAIVDSFIMSYYDGKSINDVAWGEIRSEDEWKLLTEFSKQNQNVRFNLTTASKDLARPLLKYMFDKFEYGTPKFILLMGHDSNLNPVINALGFESFELPEQFEPFPIGGKIVFQKWSDKTNEYLKVEYIYASTSQLRNGERLSVKHPPQRVLLKLNGCKISPTGYCPWSDFMKLNVYA